MSQSEKMNNDRSGQRIEHFNEDAKETMHEKINRMLVTEASLMAVY